MFFVDGPSSSPERGAVPARWDPVLDGRAKGAGRRGGLLARVDAARSRHGGDGAVGREVLVAATVGGGSGPPLGKHAHDIASQRIYGRLGPPPAAATALLLHGRDRRRGGLLVAQLEVGAHLVADVALRSDDVPLAVGGGVGLVEDGAGAAGRANHPVGVLRHNAVRHQLARDVHVSTGRLQTGRRIPS